MLLLCVDKGQQDYFDADDRVFSSSLANNGVGVLCGGLGDNQYGCFTDSLKQVIGQSLCLFGSCTEKCRFV